MTPRASVASRCSLLSDVFCGLGDELVNDLSEDLSRGKQFTAGRFIRAVEDDPYDLIFLLSVMAKRTERP